MARIIISILLIFFSFQSHSQIAMFHAHNQTAGDLLLDLYPNATGAWSLRKLDKDWNGAAIFCYKSGGASATIGFIGTDLDTTSLMSFAAGGTVWVSIVYDQTGSGRHMYGGPEVYVPTSDTGLFPKIVVSGVLQKIGTRPALYFDGVNDVMSAVATKSLTTSQSSIIVFNQDGGMTFARVLTQRDTLQLDQTNYIPVVRNSTTTSFLTAAGASGLQAGKTLTYNSSYIWLNTHSGALISNSINNDSDATFSHTLNVTPYRYRISGSYNNTTNEANSQHMKGFVAEAVFWGNQNYSSSKSGIFSNINSYYTIY